jgi:hypothetical protein
MAVEGEHLALDADATPHAPLPVTHGDPARQSDQSTRIVHLPNRTRYAQSVQRESRTMRWRNVQAAEGVRSGCDTAIHLLDEGFDPPRVPGPADRMLRPLVEVEVVAKLGTNVLRHHDLGRHDLAAPATAPPGVNRRGRTAAC